MEKVAAKEREGSTLPICPRCGAPYLGVHQKNVHGRTYLYAYHGKVGKRPQYCYLGPADSYVHVESVIPLDLKSLEDVDLIAVAFNAVSLHVSRLGKLESAEKRETARKLKALAEDILKLAENLEHG